MTAPAATPPLVLWTVAAHRRLRQALAECMCHGGARIFMDTMNDLTNRLQRVFDGVLPVIVQDQFVGFRRRTDEFILLVEVTDIDRCGRYVVKLAPEKRLRQELDAWESCRPHGLHHDLVLMPLDPRYDGGKLIGLVYGDAQQFLGVPTTTSLENAFLDAVRHGAPSPASVAVLLGQLFDRIGHLLYPNSFVQDPADKDFVLDVPRLRESMELWRQQDSDAARARQDVNTLATSGSGKFCDPVDYLRFLATFVPWQGPPVATPDGPPYGIMQTPARWLPRMLRGCAHGDLHGRNVLVGIVRDRALWPAVFDYENMGPGNLLAWDFVKLETELKIRAFPGLFSGGSLPEFVGKVQEFEKALAEETEGCHRRSSWPEVTNDPGNEDGTPEATEQARREGRLRSLLLAMREQASVHLGADRGRPRDWLDEYYFFLACYGVTVVRFENLVPRERIGAYLSAGVALARFLWSRTSEPLPASEVKLDANTILQSWYPSYHTQLEIARQWCRDGEPQRAEGLTLLRGLQKRYPHILAIGQELVLALMVADQREEAYALLRQLAQQFQEVDEETLCRWGRWYKEAGDKVRKTDPARAEREYSKAAEYYGKAYAIRQGHYPGINQATMLILLAAAARAQNKSEVAADRQADAMDLCHELLDRRSQWPADLSDDNIWHPATEGEAHLLLQQWSQAAAAYREALAQSNLKPFHRQSMSGQVKRVLDALEGLGVEPERPFDNVDALFAPPGAGGQATVVAQ
jgi:tetratricopeptide (TPR) repeat protein